MVRGSRTAAQAERLLRRAARRVAGDWSVRELTGRDGRRRGKGQVMLAWTTIPRHPGDLSPVAAREIEAAFEPYLGKGWMDK